MRTVNGLFALALLLAVVGCQTEPCACSRSCVSADLNERTGFGIGQWVCYGEHVMPNGASLEDGLQEDEAVLIALWNNAAFQELLTDLDVARGDLVQAGLLPNPEVGYFFPVTDKPYKYVVDFPIESLWLRPVRIDAAQRESSRACRRLSQAGLDLIRDVRQAYSDMLLAEGRRRVATEGVELRGRIGGVAKQRVEEGDISVQEGSTARNDSLLAQQLRVQSDFDVSLAEERLRHLMGLPYDRTPLKLDPPAPVPVTDFDAELLTADAVATRPDSLAADHAALAAAERVRLAQLSWVRFLGILDATSGRDTGHEFGPAFRATLPIFNHNEGAIARAEAEWDRARRNRETVRVQISLDVHQAYLRYRQASSELEVVEHQVIPEVDAALRRAEVAYREGDLSSLVVLEATRQLLDTNLRQQQLQADLRRAWADLQRSVGRRLDVPTPLPEVIDTPPP